MPYTPKTQRGLRAASRAKVLRLRIGLDQHARRLAEARRNGTPAQLAQAQAYYDSMLTTVNRLERLAGLDVTPREGEAGEAATGESAPPTSS
jgi:hypothetical protein